jgi:hypothetical protein
LGITLVFIYKNQMSADVAEKLRDFGIGLAAVRCDLQDRGEKRLRGRIWVEIRPAITAIP